LRRVARRQLKVAAGSALIGAAAVALLVVLGSSLLLGYVSVGRWMRIPAAAIAWALVIYGAAWLLRPAVRKWGLGGAARQVERAVPGLHERMSSAVELLTLEQEPAFRGSPQLVAHLLAEAREQAAGIDPRHVVAADPLIRRGAALLTLCIAWMVLAINPHTSRPVLRGAYATLFPWQRHVPAALAAISVSPGDIVLTQGDALEIRATVPDGNRISEASLIQRFADGQTISQTMQADSRREFHCRFENLNQGFSYHIRTESGESEQFTVAVLPRPTISKLDIHYDYPAYSHIAASDSISSDGAIQGLAGTNVTLTVHCSDVIALDQSNILLMQDGRDPQNVPLAQDAPGAYRATFKIQSNGDYRIQLVNAQRLGNRDRQARPIVVQYDQPPAVTILSPVGQATVRPDDMVPIEFSATDDFAVASLSAMVSTDDGPLRVIPLPLPAGDHRSIRSTWAIDVQDVLQKAGAAKASRISYQLRATDNRDPDPQAGLSAMQALVLSSSAMSYSQQINEQRKRQFQEAIRKAIEQLQQAEWRSRTLKDLDGRHLLNPDERRNAADLRELLVNTSGELSAAAQQFVATPYAQLAREVQQIAEHPIADAAADSAQVEFNADQPAQRQRNAASANQHVTQARLALEKLLPSLEQTLHKSEAMDALRQAARKQNEAAEEMAANPSDADAKHKQQEAIDRLNEAVSRDPALGEGNARELARALTELAQRVEGEQSRQSALNKDTSRQIDAAQSADAGQASKDAQAKTKAAIERLSHQQDELGKQTEELRQAAEQLTNRAKQQKSTPIARRAEQARQALDRAQQSQHRAADAAAQRQADRAAEEQGKAQEDLARAQQALRDSPASEQASNPDAQNQANAQKSDAASGTNDGGSPGQSQENGGDAQQASREAAQAAQEAQAAQRQALAPNPAAAAQAASALARATAAAQRAAQDSAQSAGQQSAPGQSADAGASPDSAKSNSTPGQGINSSGGLRGQNRGGANTPPAAVLDLGVSPADWAKLPPQMQQDLSSASQQSAPPAYREMVRDYYTRIARMQTTGH
jgi:hypothetical protein